MSASSDILNAHESLCHELDELMQRERQLLESGQMPSEAELARKQDLLPRLEATVADLKTLNEVPAAENPGRGEQISRMRKQMMRLFYLDRENEKLIRKLVQAQRQPSEVRTRGTAQQAEAAYAAQLRGR